jgi:hypothetical protein
MNNRQTFIAVLIASCLAAKMYAQEKKVETKFFRPSMTTTFLASKTSQTSRIIGYFNQLPIEARFDERRVQNNLLTATNSKELIPSLAPVSREIIGSIFGRDASGNMTYDKLMEAAKYAATDNQALSSGASKDNTKVYFQIADELLKRSYIVSYDITRVQTYDEYYSEQEKRAREVAARSGKPATPVVRAKEGWIVNYTFYVHRLIWNDTVQNQFFGDIWLDPTMKEERSKRIAAFENYRFPLELVYSSSGSATSAQSNDPNYYNRNAFARRRSMDELLSAIPKMIQDRMVFKGGKKIDDFKMRAPIFQEYPTTAKLGKKEGLYYDQRFFVYEVTLDNEGNQHKKRKGVIRPKTIADNAKIADGDSPATVFQQQGGRYLYQGSLVELKEDAGIGLSIGYGLVDNIAGGVNVGLDLSIPRFTKNILPTGVNRMFRNYHLSGSIGINSFSSITLFQPTDTYINSLSLNYTSEHVDSVKSNYNSYKFSGSSTMLNVSLSREIYFTKKGNIFVTPEIAYSVLGISARQQGIKDTNAVAKYTFSNSALMGGIGIGFHITPSIQLFAKAFVNYKLDYFGFKDKAGQKFTTDESGNLKSGAVFATENTYLTQPIEKISSSWGMNNMNKLTTPVYIGVRFKF